MLLFTRKFKTALVAAVALLTISCGGHSEYHADYAPFDSVPCNVETNIASTTTMVKRFPGSYMFKSDYPQYNAVVYYGLVIVPDSGKIRRVLANHFDRMSDRIGIYESEIRTLRKDSSSYAGWVMVTPRSQAPVQMLATDSASMVLHGTMEFTSPQTDSVRAIFPAVEAIAADMEHLIKNLKQE